MIFKDKPQKSEGSSGEKSTFGPLWRKRTPNVERFIDKNAQPSESDQKQIDKYGYVKETGYIFTGADPIQKIGKEETLRSIFEAFQRPGRNGQFLEIGPGHANFAIGMAKQGDLSNYHSLDVLPMASPQNRAKLAEVHADFRTGIAEGNVERIHDAYQPNTMDFILCSMVLEHVADPLGTLQQLYDVLKPGGIISIIDGEYILPGLEGQLENIVDSLQKAGYQLTVRYSYGEKNGELVPTRISELTLKKTADHEHLQLPVHYKVQQNEVVIDESERKVSYEYVGGQHVEKKHLPNAITSILEREPFREKKFSKNWLIDPLSREAHLSAIDQIAGRVKEEMERFIDPNGPLSEGEVKMYENALRVLLLEKLRESEIFLQETTQMVHSLVYPEQEKKQRGSKIFEVIKNRLLGQRKPPQS